MRYNLRPNKPRLWSQIVIGSADDARWRYVDQDCIDSMLRHEHHHEVQRAIAERKSAERRAGNHSTI